MKPFSCISQIGKEVRCFVGVFDQLRFASLFRIPLRDLAEFPVNDEVGHAGTLRPVKSPPVLIGANDVDVPDTAQFLQRMVPEDDLVLTVDDERRDGGCLEHVVELPLAVLQGLLGHFLLRDVLKGLNGPDDFALMVPDRSRGEPEPLARLPQVGKEIRRLEGLVDQFRLAVFPLIPLRDFIVLSVHQQIGHAGPGLRVECPPVVGCPHDLPCGNGAQFLQGPVPVQNTVIAADDEGGNRRCLEDAAEDLPVRDEWLAGRLDGLLILWHGALPGVRRLAGLT